MATKEIEAIVVDFFGVICPDLTDEWLKDSMGAKGKIDRASIKAIDDKANLDKISAQEYYSELADITGSQPQQVEGYFNKKIVINTELLSVLEALKNQYKIIMLSNSNSTMLRNILDHYSLSSYFDDIIISGEVGYIKPQTEIYQLVLDRLSLRPLQVIYIDDRLQNIEAAEKIGIKGILYKNNTEFNEEFGKINLV